MAAIVGEELLATEAAAGEAAAAESTAAESATAESGVVTEGLATEGEAYTGRGVPGNRYLGESGEGGGGSSSSAFRADRKPKGFSWNNFYNSQAVINTAGGVLQGVTQLIGDTYNNYRKDKDLQLNARESLKDRYRAGIVFMGQENRDQLVRENRIPAYYSTSNIKSLLRRGIMPFGWNSEMAIEQGFGKEIMAQEQKAVISRNAKHILEEQREKLELRKSLGELKNLRDRFKTRKILEYYHQR